MNLFRTRRSDGHRRRLAIATLAAVVALTGAACGDDDESKNGQSGTETTTHPTGSPLRLGMLVDQTGPQGSHQGAVVKVAKAWVEEVNANGGIADHPVELVIKDTRGDAPTGSTVAQELIDDPSVIGALVVDASAESVFGPALSRGGLPVIGGLGYDPRFWGAVPNVWGITTSFPHFVFEQLIAAEAAGATTTALAACAEVAVCSASAPVFEQASAKLGLEYAGLVTIAADAPNYTAECLQFIKDGVDFVQLGASAAVSQRLAADCRTQGYDGYFGASAGTVNPGLYGGQTDIRLTGGLTGFPWFVDAAPVRKFRDVMEKQGVDEDEYGSPPMTATYASLELFRKVVEGNAATLGDEPDRAGVVAAYGTVADETLDGLLPDAVTFVAGEPGPPIRCFWLYTFEGGKFSGDFEPTCPGPEFD